MHGTLICTHFRYKFCIKGLVQPFALTFSSPCWQRRQQSHMVSRNDGPGAWILILRVSHGHKEHVRPFQIPAGMSHLGLSTSPIFNNVLLSDSILLKVLSLLLAGFSSSSVISHLFLAEGLFKKALSLPLSMNTLPIPFVFPTCTAPDNSPDNLCRYAKGRFRSYNWKWGDLPGQLMSYFVSIKSPCVWAPLPVNTPAICKAAIWNFAYWNLILTIGSIKIGTLIVATIYLQLIQNRYMFRNFTVLQCSHQHCVKPVASDLEVVGYL